MASAETGVAAGLVVVDKPGGMTSHDVVSRCRRLFGTRKVGHAGTLDPMATGVLVVGIARATKILGLLTATAKSYSATIRLGRTTSTDDAEGEVLQDVPAGSVTDDAIVAAIDAMMDAAAAWGPIDILVNNAGIQKTVPIGEATAEIWDAIIAVNLSGAFHTMRHALPGMGERGFGRVVNIASVHGLVASKDKAPYVASKFGLVGMSKVAALEYAACGNRETGGVTVNCICPGWTETAIIEPQVAARAAEHGGDRAAGIASLLAEKQPSQRTSDPSEIGALAAWLCHAQAHNITGASFPVDGGWTAQ